MKLPTQEEETGVQSKSRKYVYQSATQFIVTGHWGEGNSVCCWKSSEDLKRSFCTFKWTWLMSGRPPRKQAAHPFSVFRGGVIKDFFFWVAFQWCEEEKKTHRLSPGRRRRYTNALQRTQSPRCAKIAEVGLWMNQCLDQSWLHFI